ncbi:hypothetical protein BXZ70DRAFT_783982 [Cristinia sonorae]|uniref:Uncharacterized protein n=1 Tax=Cristinia sonorae TaxID=1940300 RepID=A0A8K0UR21_9AGAR|nr:hypothetical protein BXZ70DRAFT_783982 [Cristinia sonorae]
MFSQWRQAVESLAQGPVQPPSKPSQDADTSRGSSDSIRPSPSTIQPRPSTSESPGSRQPGHRTTLEDRLRAKFAIGDASNSTTPNASSRPSRVTTPMSDHPLSPPSSSRPQSPTPEVKADFVHPLSPTSAPLPDSPLLTSVNTLDTLSIERMGAAEDIQGRRNQRTTFRPSHQVKRMRFRTRRKFRTVRGVLRTMRKEEANFFLKSQTRGRSFSHRRNHIPRPRKTLPLGFELRMISKSRAYLLLHHMMRSTSRRVQWQSTATCVIRSTRLTGSPSVSSES